MDSVATGNDSNMLNIDVKRIERSSKEKFDIWFFQNRYLIFGGVSLVFLASIINFVEFRPVRWDFGNEVYEEVAFVSNLQVQQQQSADAPQVAEGDITPTEELKKAKEDTRVASAVNPFMVNASAPVDLTPSIRPEYTVAAEKIRFEGTLVLSVVIADTGEVLQVVPRFKDAAQQQQFTSLGLTQSAVMAYRKKRFKPALKDGSGITVKVNIPVRFVIGM